MRKLTTDEQRWLDEYIRNEFEWPDNAGADISDEMRMAIVGSFEFQRYLQGIYWARLKSEIITSLRWIFKIF